MRLFSSLWLFVKSSPNSTGAANTSKPRLESLEDRLVPAATSHDFVASAEKALANRNFNPAFDNGLVAALDAHQINPAIGYSQLDVTAIIQSQDDSIRYLVKQMYEGLLQRDPTAADGTFFFDILKGGARLQDAKMIMIASDEYFNHAGGGTNDGFISAIFADYLGRQVDPLGHEFYTDILTNAPTDPSLANTVFNRRFETARYIINSSEGANTEVRFLYNAYLQRPADNFGAPIFIGQLIAFTGFPQTPSPEQTIIAIMVSSPEFFDKS